MIRVGERDTRMEFIYVSGAIRAETEYDISLNVENARRVAAELWKKGHAPLCPHTNGLYMMGIVPLKQFLLGDLYMIEKCDALLMLPNWEDSKGALLEHEYAKERDIKIYYDLEEVPNIL